jgi:GT2 family glycosyltransferase
MYNHSKTAIVILNWNGKKFLEEFLPGVVANSRGVAKVIVADNASTDDSVQFLSSLKNDVELIQLDKNYGFTGGYNRALKQVNAEYYILLNSDVEVTPNFIEPVISFLDNNRDVAACQPKVRSYIDKHLLEHAGAAGGYIDWMGYPFCRGRLFTQLEEDNGQYDEICDVFWATGACMFIRSEIFHKENGFDEDFFAHMEEIDLCWRIQSAGYRLCVIPESKVFHVGGGTLPKSSARKTFYNFRNNLMMLHKNLPANKLWFVLLTRLVLDGVAGLKFLFEGGFSDLIAVMKAHNSFFRKLPRRIKVRREQQKRVVNSKPKGFYSKSVLFDYFIKRKIKFSDLDQNSIS